MKSVSVELAGRGYSVIIGAGARAALPGLVAGAGPAARIVVIADERVAALHLPKLQKTLSLAVVLTVPPGEANKSLATASRLYDGLAAARIERGDLLITFGGGVTGDLGGFVAATWLRGIRFIQVPTTMEAAVDAAVGGKTAVNHPAGKNLIGVFHQPSAVVVDLEFLETLPERDYRAGLGESVKHAAIRDPDFLTWHEAHGAEVLAREPESLAELIARNCRIKAEVVACDEREEGLRAILNYGHTIGHALEHELKYALRHGECVALGMAAANTIAVARGMLADGVAGRIARLLAQLGLPNRLPWRVDPARIVALCQADKKVRGGAVHFVLLEAPGKPVRRGDVTPGEIVAAVEVLQP